MLQDHDQHVGSVGNLRLLDNTNYPHTPDVCKTYTSSDDKTSQFIAGFTNLGENSAITFSMMQYHHPLDFTCPHQCSGNNKQFNSILQFHMKSLKFNYMQEYILRLNDYLLAQITNSFADTNPCQDIVRRIEEKLDPFMSKELNFD